MRAPTDHDDRERGGTLVEAALVLPAVMLLLLGMLEMGLYFKDSLTLGETTRNAAHTGAQYAAVSDADYYILQTVKRLNTAIGGSVVEVVVYNADNQDPSSQSKDNVSSVCTASGTATGVDVPYTDGQSVLHATGGIGSCNVYRAANGDLNRPDSDFVQGTFVNAQHWPGASRFQSTTDTRANGQAGPDLIGVWVLATHGWMTGIIRTGSSPLTAQAVFRIEPRQ
jgi:hypothetical protein